MSWSVAKSLDALLAEVNSTFPNRDKSSDGSIGDTAHSSRKSDHNPNGRGVVCARDFTAAGGVARAIADAIVSSKDTRVNYLIFEGRIISSKPVGGHPAWTWRSYSGSNPHNKHIHVSVKQDAAVYDRTYAWGVCRKPAPAKPAGPKPVAPATGYPRPKRVLEQGDAGQDVRNLQSQLNARGYTGTVDGAFGPKLNHLVRYFQKRNRLTPDGVVGPATVKALWG